MTSRNVMTTAAGTRPEAFGPAEWGLLAAIALMWGSSFLFIAVGLESFPPALITFLRVAFGTLALGLVPRSRRPIEAVDRLRVWVLGAVWIAVPLSMFPIAEQWIDSATAGMLNGAMPIFAGLTAALLMRRFPGRLQSIGLLVGFAGVALISAPARTGGEGEVLGVVLVVFATVCYGLSVNLAVPLQQRYGSLPVIWHAQLVGVVLLAGPGLLSIRNSSFSVGALAAVLALGVLGTGLAFIAMATLVGRAGATRGSIAIYFIPIVAAVEGVVFRSEEIPLVALAGMVLVVGGAYLASRRETPPPGLRPSRAVSREPGALR